MGMLEVRNLDVCYGQFRALSDVTIRVPRGKIVSLIGANGAGKSTLLKAVASLLQASSGSISFEDRRIDGLESHKVVELGISLVPEGRKIFPSLNVLENLRIGAYPKRARRSRNENLEKVFHLFPRLKERIKHLGANLSGGEQQMLAIGRALMACPRLIIFDEISLGLSPLVVRDLFEAVQKINEEGVTVMLVEQDVKRSLRAAHHAYVLLEGRVALEGPPEELTEEAVKKAYFGV
jgi:branched-chain amino acid transport system ATP-binding protein